MANLTRQASFTAFVAATEGIVGVMASADIPDALMLVARHAGWNNLQGHARGVIPLAAWFARAHPYHLATLRSRTNLSRNMSGSSSEARSQRLWVPIQSDLRNLLAARGADVIAIGTTSRSPVTAAGIARTYLSRDYGGRQKRGGAGNTVFKRTLKLLSHALLE